MLRLASCLTHKFGFELHRAKTFNLAVDVVVALNQANVFDFRPYFDHAGGAFQFEVLDQCDCVAVLQDIARSVFENLDCVHLDMDMLWPFMSAFRADEVGTIFVSEFRFALGAVWERHVSIKSSQVQVA